MRQSMKKAMTPPRARSRVQLLKMMGMTWMVLTHRSRDRPYVQIDGMPSRIALRASPRNVQRPLSRTKRNIPFWNPESLNLSLNHKCHHLPQKNRAAQSRDWSSIRWHSSISKVTLGGRKLDPSIRRVSVSTMTCTIRTDFGRQSFSAIVGPNGSGKSNTIDALLFVFGYRASKMRQGKLSELIHNSARYPDLDECSVEVHFRDIVDLVGFISKS